MRALVYEFKTKEDAINHAAIMGMVVRKDHEERFMKIERDQEQQYLHLGNVSQGFNGEWYLVVETTVFALEV